MIDTNKYEGLNEAIDRIINSDEIGVDDLLADSMVIKDGINELLAEVKWLREAKEQLLARVNRSNRQLVRATEWAYKQYCYKQEKMEDFDNYVWGE